MIKDIKKEVMLLSTSQWAAYRTEPPQLIWGVGGTESNKASKVRGNS